MKTYSKLLLAFFLLVLFEHLPNICSIGDAKTPKSLPDLLDEVRPSIVAIKAGKYMGSGFVVARNMICTNAHVIEEASEVSVKFNDGTQKSALGTLYLDEETDIAILKVSQVPASIKSLSILNALPRQGERVVAIGHPKGATNTATDGIVSALRSGNQVEKILKLDGFSGVWIQTNAAINKGNSGGPLLNFFGEVVGMNALGFSSVEGVENMNFAISSSNIRPAIHIARSSPLVIFDAGTKSPQSYFDSGFASGVIQRAAKQKAKENKISLSQFCKLERSNDTEDDILYECFKLHFDRSNLRNLQPRTIVRIAGSGQHMHTGFLGRVVLIHGVQCLLVDKHPGTSASRQLKDKTVDVEGLFLVHKPQPLDGPKGPISVYPLVKLSDFPADVWRDPLKPVFQSLNKKHPNSIQLRNGRRRILKTDGTGHPFIGHLYNDLSSANLEDADLKGAVLENANLTGTKLARANLTGANLTGANLTGTKLTGANLTGANLTGANLTGADLADATLDHVSAGNITGTPVHLPKGWKIIGSYLAQHGPYTKYYPNGQKEEEGCFKKGIKHGPLTRWYENGQKKNEEHWKNGMREGLWVSWYENGQKEREYHYKNGESDGVWTAWYENGKKSISLQPVDRAGFDRVIAEHASNVVLVDFWASWCMPCRQTFPHTVGLYDKLHDQGLAVVSLSMDQLQDKPKALEFLYQQGATFDNLISSYGPVVEGFHAFGIPDAIPYFTLYDRQGKLRYRFSPLFVDGKDGEPLEAIDARVGQLLSEK